MANLFELLKQAQPQNQAPIDGQSEQIASMLKTRLTGEVQPASSDSPRRSQIGEQQVAQQARAQSQELATQARIGQQQQRQQAQEQEQAQKIQLQDLKQNIDEKRQQASLQTQDILNTNLQGIKKLKTQEDVANFEQAAFMARLSSQSYIENLTNAANKARIDDDATFTEKYYEQVMKDDMEDFQDVIDFKTLTMANDRDFAKQVAQMDLATAIKIADRANNQANAQALFTGIGNMVSGGVQAYSVYDKYQTKQANQQEG